MPANKNNNNAASRRDFLIKGSLASVGMLMAGKALRAKTLKDFFGDKPDSKFFGVQIGVITYSYRSMPGSIEQILQYVVGSGISAIELMGDAAEEYAGKPEQPTKIGVLGAPPPTQQQKDADKAVHEAYLKQVADWRSTVAMDKFEEIRKMYHKAGVSIYAFKPNALNTNNSDAEIEYALKAAKALGARCVTVELPAAAQSKRLGDLGEKHKIYIGYHAHTQATDTAWDVALGQSPYNSMNLDCGHYIAAGGNNTKETLLALIDAKHDRITTMHIKDRKTKGNGAANMPWGQGDTPVKEILNLLKDKKYNIPATIELEYDIPAGSDAVKETKNCLMYAKAALGA